MGIRSLLVALAGVAIASGSAYATREYLMPAAATAAPETKPQLASVIIARADIGYGQSILPQSVTTIPWPREALPPGAYVDLASLLPASGQQPRRATHEIAKGDILLASKVSDFGDKVTIVQALGPNLRAVAISVSAETAVGGFVTPGDNVDIVLTQGGDKNMRAITILQNIRILGVDQDADMKRDQPEVARTVTVEVTPEQGQVLALAQNAGKLSLSLRTLNGARDSELPAVNLSDILQEPPPPAPVAAAPVAVPEPVKAVTRIKIRRANEVEVVSLD